MDGTVEEGILWQELKVLYNTAHIQGDRTIIRLTCQYLISIRFDPSQVITLPVIQKSSTVPVLETILLMQVS